jgi:hypothetical protein
MHNQIGRQCLFWSTLLPLLSLAILHGLFNSLMLFSDHIFLCCRRCYTYNSVLYLACGKKFCTGIETCPAIVMLIFGFLIVLCGIGMVCQDHHSLSLPILIQALPILRFSNRRRWSQDRHATAFLRRTGGQLMDKLVAEGTSGIILPSMEHSLNSILCICSSNSTFYDRSQWTCTECPWIFQNCDHASQEWPCGRGCVLTVGSGSYFVSLYGQRDKWRDYLTIMRCQIDPRQTFCLVQTFGEVLSNQWSSFSVLQKIGLGVAVGGVALIVIGLIYSVFKGKKMLM